MLGQQVLTEPERNAQFTLFVQALLCEFSFLARQQAIKDDSEKHHKPEAESTTF